LKNIDKYLADFQKLLKLGIDLEAAIQFYCLPQEFTEAVKKAYTEPKKVKEYLDKLPKFKDEYQTWYSESKVLIKQLLPDRLLDFTKLYEKQKTRKDITYENYTIEDCLQGLNVTRGYEKTKIVGPDAAIAKYKIQNSILQSVNGRFSSSLYDIKTMVQADFFDSELDAASELLKNKFFRSAGAISGVILEKHLKEICNAHEIKIVKKTPTISDLNDLLKSNDVVNVPDWRFIQHLGDLRNICDHDKEVEPTKEQIQDLIHGVEKIIKTVF
jgi:hypothetical protein